MYKNGGFNVSTMVSQNHPAGAIHGCRQMFVEYTVMLNQGLPSGLLHQSELRSTFRVARPIRTKTRLQGC